MSIREYHGLFTGHYKFKTSRNITNTSDQNLSLKPHTNLLFISLTRTKERTQVVLGIFT